MHVPSKFTCLTLKNAIIVWNSVLFERCSRELSLSYKHTREKNENKQAHSTYMSSVAVKYQA